METYWYDLHEAFAHAEATRTPLRNVCRAIHGRQACSRLWGGEPRVGIIDTGYERSVGPCPKLRFQDGTWIWLDLTIRMVMEEEDLDIQLVSDALAIRPAQSAAELARSTHLGTGGVMGALRRLQTQGAVKLDGRHWTSTVHEQARRPIAGPEYKAGNAARSMAERAIHRGQPVSVAS